MKEIAPEKSLLNIYFDQVSFQGNAVGALAGARGMRRPLTDGHGCIIYVARNPASFKDGVVVLAVTGEPVSEISLVLAL